MDKYNHFEQHFYVERSFCSFYMRPRMSITESVRPPVGPSVCPPVGPSLKHKNLVYSVV